MNILYLTQPLALTAREVGMPTADLAAKITDLKAKLIAARAERVQPRCDDKVIAGWNGLMIGSLAQAGELLHEPAYLGMAEKAAAFATATLMQPDGMLRRDWRAHRLGPPAFQDDYAYLADGLLDLADATGDSTWADHAGQLTDTMLAKFWDSKNGDSSKTTGDNHLLVRLKNPYDGALPSGNAVAVRVLIRLARRTGDAAYSAKARATLAAFGGALQASPQNLQLLALASQGLNDSLQDRNETSAVEPDRVGKDEGEGIVRVHADTPALKVESGKPFTITLTAVVQSGWHVNSSSPGDPDLVPTRITVGQGSLPVALAGDVEYPPAQSVVLGGSRLSVYENRFRIIVPVVANGIGRSVSGYVAARVTFQSCSDRVCLPSDTQEVRVPVTILR